MNGDTTEDSAGGPTCTAVICDVSDSRRLARERRFALQNELEALLERLDDEHRNSLLSRFAITMGDEFQALFHAPAALSGAMWSLDRELPDVEFWIGVGHGRLDTGLKERAVGMDGPAFHRARDAVKAAKRDGRRGGVFRGFAADDAVLDGLARLLHRQRAGFTDAQREALELVRSGLSQTEAAEVLELTRQAVNKRVRAAGWDTYREGEGAFVALLERYRTTEAWG